MRSAFRRWSVAMAAAAAALVAVTCTDDRPVGINAAQSFSTSTFPAPANEVTVDGFTFFPYTANNFYADPQDPINLVFTGNVDPRQIRAALLALPDGDRSAVGFPNTFPFNCTWRDALGGDEQVTYAAGGWTGSVIQLACGDYSPVRFHVRLFPAGDRTAGNAHFEVHIPGTADHQVLNWEIAEQLVAADLFRTGIAAPTGSASGINAQPYFRIIREQVYDALPPELQALAYTVSENVHGMPTDGNATVFTVFGEAEPVPGAFEQTQVLQYDVVDSKPFCATADVPYVHISGPVTMWQTDLLTASGECTREFHAEGTLSITPIDLATGQPDFSRTYRAIVRQRHQAAFWDGMLSVTADVKQSEVPPTGLERGRFRSLLQLGPNGRTNFDATESCSP